jgi:surface polysaccharide O-acyltransferase-like enzyme
MMSDSELSPQPQPGPGARPREYALDWLRVIAFVVLIGYHCGMYFVPWPWSVKNPVSSQWLTWVMDFFNRWRLPLLFFISGAGVCFSLERRTQAQFVRERLRRLLIPLVFGMFVIIPPQIYVERVMAGWHYTSYWAFWGTTFTTGAYPKGNLSWHHLWFLPYILTYSLLGLPLFAALRTRAGRAWSDGLARLCDRPGFIYLLNLPNIAVGLWLGPHWPTTHNLTSDWADFTGSLITFLWGFIICGNPRFLDLIERRRREFLYVALGMTVLFYGRSLPQVLPNASHFQWLILNNLIDAYFGMAMILSLVGWGRALLNQDSAALRYATAAVYPFYITHQTITILLGYAWLGWNVPFVLKFPALFGGTLLGSWLIYEAVRRHPLSRLLFGMKPQGSP